MKKIIIKANTEINQQNIVDALALDKRTYDDLYFVDINQCFAWFDRNPYIYIMAFTPDNELMGYINFSPVKEEFFLKMCEGKNVDTVIEDDDVLPYLENHEYYAYFSSIVVDKKYRGQGVAKAMLLELDKMIISLAKDRNIYIKAIVGDAISDKGRDILANYGLEALKSSSHDSTIMMGYFLNNSLKETIYNKEILDIYRRKK